MIYRDQAMPTHRRVADLLNQMTREEKLAQLGVVPGIDLLEVGSSSKAKLASMLEHGVGWITMLAGHTNLGRQEVAELSNRIQEHLVNETRLGIPAIMQDDSLSGFSAADATVFPMPLGIAASWRPGSARRVASVVASQMRAAGIHATLAPVLDLARDPRLRHFETTFGEDPHLISSLGLAELEGLQQGDGNGAVLAAAKHLATESQAALDPFEQLVRHGNLGAIVYTTRSTDGQRRGLNLRILNDLLRDSWAFGGAVITTDDLQSETVMAIEAGVDLDLSLSGSLGKTLLGATELKATDEPILDRAVGHVLTRKFELGLFDELFVRSSDVAKFDGKAGLLAAEVAAEALVLLKNDGDLLPLEPGLSLALIGPNADDPRAMVGSAAHVAHQEQLALWRDHPESTPIEVSPDLELDLDVTRLGSLSEELTKHAKSVRYVEGVELDSPDRSQIASAVAAAAESDVAIVVLGERSGLTPDHTTGGPGNRARINLPSGQQELVEAVVATGTPTILILLSGAPNSTEWAAEHVPSILWAILPGQAGAIALAETLFGQREPRGRLPISIARDIDRGPHHYGDGSDPNGRLWPFGHGLGYTTFELATASGPDSILTGDQELLVAATVENTGARSGETIVQVYKEDPSSDVDPRTKQLIWFGAIALDAGQRQDITIRIPVGRLAKINSAGQRVVAAGSAHLAVGFSAEAIAHRIDVDLIGTDRMVSIPPIAH